MGSCSALMPEGLTPARFVLAEISDGANIVAHAPGGVSEDWHEGGGGPNERTTRRCATSADTCSGSLFATG